MKNRVLSVVTEGGRMFGFGHITRCLSISTIFERYNFDINFILNGDSSVSSILDKTKHTVFDWSKEQNKLLNILLESSFILIDSMQITDQEILNIEALGKEVIFIDDEKRRNILNRGFVVDWTVLSEDKHFIVKKEDVRYLLGSRYTPLRKEFTLAKKNSIKKDLKSIMLTLGGSDVRDLSPIILKSLVDSFPDIKKSIVIGLGFTNIKEIESHKDKNTELIFNASTSTMIELMQKSDLAIASGGQTLYELARIGTPTIAILLVENAKDDTLGWNEVGTLINIGWYDDEKLLDKLSKTIFSLQDKNIRQSMQDKAKPYIDANGALCLVDAILEVSK
ncbi:MAG: glycosyl transferase [Sulfurimonas sp.]|nr:glycosyl transferase [Sulfurimonas sp.]